jgi:hypothetical protein
MEEATPQDVGCPDSHSDVLRMIYTSRLAQIHVGAAPFCAIRGRNGSSPATGRQIPQNYSSMDYTSIPQDNSSVQQVMVAELESLELSCTLPSFWLRAQVQSWRDAHHIANHHHDDLPHLDRASSAHHSTPRHRRFSNSDGDQLAGLVLACRAGHGAC